MKSPLLLIFLEARTPILMRDWQSLDLPAELLWRRAYQTPKKFSWDPLPAFVLAS